jgi:hypothetical protein
VSRFHVFGPAVRAPGDKRGFWRYFCCWCNALRNTLTRCAVFGSRTRRRGQSAALQQLGRRSRDLESVVFISFGVFVQPQRSYDIVSDIFLPHLHRFHAATAATALFDDVRHATLLTEKGRVFVSDHSFHPYCADSNLDSDVLWKRLAPGCVRASPSRKRDHLGFLLAS